jgi:hypothetical protein
MKLRQGRRANNKKSSSAYNAYEDVLKISLILYCPPSSTPSMSPLRSCLPTQAQGLSPSCARIAASTRTATLSLWASSSPRMQQQQQQQQRSLSLPGHSVAAFVFGVRGENGPVLPAARPLGSGAEHTKNPRGARVCSLRGLQPEPSVVQLTAFCRVIESQRRFVRRTWLRAGR